MVSWQYSSRAMSCRVIHNAVGLLVASGNSLVQTVARGVRSVAREVNETARDVGMDEFHINVVAHVGTLEPALPRAFGRRLKEP